MSTVHMRGMCVMHVSEKKRLHARNAELVLWNAACLSPFTPGSRCSSLHACPLSLAGATSASPPTKLVYELGLGCCCRLLLYYFILNG